MYAYTHKITFRRSSVIRYPAIRYIYKVYAHIYKLYGHKICVYEIYVIRCPLIRYTPIFINVRP
jgi:hypothetical protein